MVTRLWQLLAGAVSVVLVLRLLSPDMQGYYYTFLSLIGLQAFFELGLYNVITNVAAHEWVHLGRDGQGNVTGREINRRRLQGLVRFTARRYSIISAGYFAVTLVAGYWLFATQPYRAVPEAMGPYAATLSASCLSLWLLPRLALLEACGQLLPVQVARLFQSVSSNVALWTGLATGMQLWSLALAQIISALAGAYFVLRVNRHFFRSLATVPQASSDLSWHREIWPMQWPIAIQGMVGFFLMSYLVPVTFRFQGPVEAGKIGLSWQIVQALQSLASVWPQVSVARLGHAAALSQWNEMKRIWSASTSLSIGSYLFTSTLLIAAMLILEDAYRQYVERLLPAAPMAFLLGAGLIALSSVNLSVYWRAHKQEPIGIFGALPGLAAAVALYLAGRHGGPDYIALAYFLTLLMVNLPLSLWAWWSVYGRYRRL